MNNPTEENMIIHESLNPKKHQTIKMQPTKVK